MSERVFVVFDAEGRPRYVADNAETAKNYGIGFESGDIREYVASSRLIERDNGYDRCVICHHQTHMGQDIPHDNDCPLYNEPEATK